MIDSDQLILSAEICLMQKGRQAELPKHDIFVYIETEKRAAAAARALILWFNDV